MGISLFGTFRWTLLGFLLVLSLGVACSGDGEAGQAVAKAGEDVQPSGQTVVTRVVVREVAGGEAKMVPLPKSLEELISGKDIIAVGRVGKIVREVAEGAWKGPVDREGNPVKETLVPHTYFELELEQVIRDDGTVARGETVLLRMSGTAQDGPIQVGEGQFMDFERTRMPKTGERRLFVLSRNPNDSYGAGDRGLLDIDGDVVRWAAYDRPVGFAAGKTPGEFLEEVEEVASADMGIDGETDTPTPGAASRSSGSSPPHFPQLREGAMNFVMEADLEGELILENGCLRAKSKGGADRLLIWPQRFKLSVDGRDIRISDDSGVSLSVGEEIRIGGGEKKLGFVQLVVKQPLPNDCPGPYWIVGEVPSRSPES